MNSRRIVSGIADGVAARVAPTDLYCLLFSFLLASLLLAYRRRRWMYGLLAIGVSVIMVTTPLLQTASLARFQERYAQAATAVQTLAEALSPSTNPAESPRRAIHNTQHATQSASPDVYCGAGDPNKDTDGDGLNAAAENCLSTNPYNEDSDNDLIPDGAEVNGFAFGGRTWPSDPVNPDSNGDGLTDADEWPESEGGNATSWDLDGDGVPNPWDDDNDGDGVPDGRDLTPSSRGAITDGFDLNLTGGFDGHVYLEIQVQPGNEDHLRYNGATLDWPDDFEGQIQDLDHSTEDMWLTPYLEVSTNQPPDEDLREHYGPISVFENEGDEDYPHRMLLRLSPVGDGSRPMAFYTRLAYGPDVMAYADVRWKDAHIVWVVTAKIDQENDSDDIVTKNTPLHTYDEPTLRVTGLQVTKSRNYASTILGIPNNDDDRQLFNLLFGLSSTWLTHQEPTFDEINRRFTSGLTDPVEKWGVTVDVEMNIPSPSGHRDAGIASFNTRVKNFLSDNYGTKEYASLVIATEEVIGSENLDDSGQLELGAEFNVNLAGVTLVTRRLLQLQMYEQGDDWSAVRGRDQVQVVADRHADGVETALNDLSGTYPDLTGADLLALTEVFYMTWQGGRSRTIATDDQPIVSEMRLDLEVYNQLNYSDTKFDTLPAYLVAVGNFAQEGGGLVFAGGSGQAWQHMEANEGVAYDLGFTAGGVAAFDKFDYGIKTMMQTADSPDLGFGEVIRENVNDVLTSDEFQNTQSIVMTSIGIVDTVVGTTAAALEAGGKAVKFTKAAGKIGKVVGPVCLAVEVGLIWGMFAAGGDYSEAAIAMAAAQTILAVVLFVICLIPVVGQVIAVILAIFALIDLIVSLTCGISISGYIVEAIAAMIYDVNVLSKMGDYDFVNPDNGLVYPDMGIIEGNRFQFAAQFEGEIVKGKPQGWVSKVVDFAVEAFGAKLNGSYVYGEYDGSADSRATAVEKNESRSCDIQGEKKECSNRVEVEYQLGTGRDIELRYKRLIRAKTHWLIIWVWKAFTFGLAGDPVEIETKYTDYPEDLEKKDRWDYDTLYLDVLPDTLDGLWDWSEIVNHDPDADGLSNSQEGSLGSNPNNWDSDGDGLSDRFEFDKQGELGTDLTKYDMDGDGLSDGDEFILNTRIDEQDSDQDGLSDGEEVYHQNQDGTWSGGWEIPLPNRSGMVWVFSDPLNADADNDGLSDSVEKEGQSSPHAYNEAPRLTLEADPLNTSPSGVTGAYVEPGDTVVMTMTLLSLPPYGVDSDLAICLPDFMTGVEVSDMRGDRTPATEAGSCGGPKWSFDDSRDDESDDMLRFFETVSATITATIQSGLSQSVTGTVEARLPYGASQPYEDEQKVLIPVAVDLDDPEVTIVSPSEGELIGGGVEHYVIGGSSYDETSWVDHIEVDLPVAETETLTRSQSLSPWTYTWELPVDGVYTLNATSTVNLEESAVYGPPQDSGVITITLDGVASDNLSGLTRVQISTDDGPWRTVWRLEQATLTDTTFVTFTDNFHDLALTATWDAIWELPNVESVQGYHSLRVRAFDEAGNEPQVLERTIIVDVIPPTSELVNRSYLYYWPHTRAGKAHTFHGVANDAGNVPAPSRPADLSGERYGAPTWSATPAVSPKSRSWWTPSRQRSR